MATKDKTSRAEKVKTTLAFDQQTKAKVDELARGKSISMVDVVRNAVMLYALIDDRRSSSLDTIKVTFGSGDPIEIWIP